MSKNIQINKTLINYFNILIKLKTLNNVFNFKWFLPNTNSLIQSSHVVVKDSLAKHGSFIMDSLPCLNILYNSVLKFQVKRLKVSFNTS